MNSREANYQRCLEAAKRIVAAYRGECPAGCDPQNSVVAVGVAAVSVGVAAYSAYSASQSKKDELDYTKDNAPTLHSYDPVLAQYNPSAPVQGYLDLERGYGGAAQNTANELNGYFQQSLATTNPRLKQNAILASRNANSYLKGEIPADVAQATARGAAQAGLTGGYGADSGMGRNLLSRDLGLTSLDLQQRGADLAGKNAALSLALNPNSAQTILGSPADYANRYDQYNVLNTDRQNKAAADAAGVANQNSVSQYNAGLAGVQASNISPATNATLSGLGTLSSMYTGGYFNGAGGSTGSTMPRGGGYQEPYSGGYGATGTSYAPGWYSYSGGYTSGG